MAIKIRHTEKLSESVLISITPTMKAQVETLAAEYKVSAAEVFRQAIQQLLEEGE